MTSMVSSLMHQQPESMSDPTWATGEPAEAATPVAGPVRLGPVPAHGRREARLLMALPRQGQIRVAASIACQLAEVLNTNLSLQQHTPLSYRPMPQAAVWLCAGSAPTGK